MREASSLSAGPPIALSAAVFAQLKVGEKRYPWPGTVEMKRGWRQSFCSLARRFRMWRSTMLLSAT